MLRHSRHRKRFLGRRRSLRRRNSFQHSLRRRRLGIEFSDIHQVIAFMIMSDCQTFFAVSLSVPSKQLKMFFTISRTVRHLGRREILCSWERGDGTFISPIYNLAVLRQHRLSLSIIIINITCWDHSAIIWCTCGTLNSFWPFFCTVFRATQMT